jgi:MFS family permease
MVPVDEAEGVEDAAALDGPTGWRNVGAAFVSMATVFGVAYSFGAFFTPMADEFGAGRSATSAVFSITAFLYFALGAGSGAAVDRFGPRPVLLIGAVAMGAGLALTSIVDRLWLGYLTYGIGVGIGVACGYVPMVAVVGGWFVRRRSMAFGIAVAGIGVGTLGVAPLAAVLIEDIGWRSTYRVFALAAVVAMIGCSFVASSPPRATSGAAPAGGSTRREEIRSTPFVLLYVSGLLVSLALFMVFIFLAPFAEEQGAGKVAAAALVGVVGAASIAGRLLLGGMADRLGSVRTYKACFLVIAVSYLLWLATSSYPVLLVFAVIFGVAYGGFIALSPAVMADLFGTAAMGQLVGVLYTSAAFGALLGPPLAGLAVDRTGSYRWALAAASASAFVGWLILSRLPTPAPATGSTAAPSS